MIPNGTNTTMHITRHNDDIAITMQLTHTCAINITSYLNIDKAMTRAMHNYTYIDVYNQLTKTVRLSAHSCGILNRL